jgi:SAM-dependent methyltransferase
MRTDPNAIATFAAVAAEVQQRAPDRTARIVDAGCGSGQLLQALADAGYRELTGLAYQAPDIAGIALHRGIDLSAAGWAAAIGQRFDVLIATDVIEHLENPLQFLREMAAAAADGAWLLLSFPNVHNLRSIIGYALAGRPTGFFGPNLSDKPLYDQHVWMPNDHIVEFYLRVAGFAFVARRYVHGPGRLFSQTQFVVARRRPGAA